MQPTNRSGMYYRAVIPPVAQGELRPIWSVMIPTYNCAHYLRETLESVLLQAPGPEFMQIEVVDDYSGDDPETVVAELGRGRVGFYRHPANVGHITNFATCLARSRGHLIHLLHGDDLVRDGFYQKMQGAFAQQPEIGAAFCRHEFVDGQGNWLSTSRLEQAETGILDNWLERLATEQRIMTPSIVVRRDVYERLGGFDQRLLCAEDWEMWVRIAAQYPVWYESEPLASYRMHDRSNTGRHTRTGEDMRFTRMAIDMFRAYLPPDRADEIITRARETYAFSALRQAKLQAARLDATAMLAQLREAWQLSHSSAVISRTLLLLLTIALRVPRYVLSRIDAQLL